MRMSGLDALQPTTYRAIPRASAMYPDAARREDSHDQSRDGESEFNILLWIRGQAQAGQRGVTSQAQGAP